MMSTEWDANERSLRPSPEEEVDESMRKLLPFDQISIFIHLFIYPKQQRCGWSVCFGQVIAWVLTFLSTVSINVQISNSPNVETRIFSFYSKPID